jgi:hypothetical protein
LKIFLFDFKSQKWSDLATGTVGMANMAHDGQYIYFGSVQSGEQVLKRVRIRDHKVDVVTGLKDLNRNGFRLAVPGWEYLQMIPRLRCGMLAAYDIYSLDWALP